HPPGDPAAVLSGGEGADRDCRPAWRGQRRRAVPQGGHQPESLLSLVQGLPGGGQEAAGGRYCTRSDQRRSEGAARGDSPAQGAAGRADDGEPRAQKKRAGGWGVRYMRYPAAEKLEIIRLVEQSSLPVRRTLVQLGIPRSTFYCWYDRYRARDDEGLEDRTPAPRRVWNKIPAAVTQAVLELALKEPELSPRELAVSFVDQQQYFVSEASVYRLLKAHDLITSPAFILLKAADHFA